MQQKPGDLSRSRQVKSYVSEQDSQRIIASVDKRARLPARLIVLARSRDLAEETIHLIVDPGGKE